MKGPANHHAGNVVPLRTVCRLRPTPYDELTAALILRQHREGTLPEGIVVALLASAGVRP